jgi:putative nucleotidyltransferase with HDIG domain
MTAHELVAKARNLPPISEAAIKLVGLLDQSDTSNEDVVDILKCDSVLTAKLLRACNAPSMALDSAVNSVDQAVLLLGHAQIHRIALSLTFGGSIPGFAEKAHPLWRHALTTATAAESLINSGVEIEACPSIGFTVGLLHDIGKLVMARTLSQETLAAIDKHSSAEGLTSVQSEREVIGTDHAEIGSCLLYIWRLPDAIVEAVANHHSPVLDPAPRLSAVASIANRLAHVAEGENEFDVSAFTQDEPILKAFQLRPEELDDQVTKIRSFSGRVNDLIAVF